MSDIRVDENDLDGEPGRPVHYAGELFTGEAVETRPDGTVIALATYVDGLQHGVEREWFDDGTPRREGCFTEGKAQGTHRMWHRDGQLASAVEFSATGYPSRRAEWDENGNMTTDYSDAF